MRGDELDRFQAAMGAIAKITSDDVDADLVGARCPKCNWSGFVKIADLYAEAVGRLEDQPESGSVAREGGMTDLQIVQKFKPPRRKSPTLVVASVVVPLAAGAYYVYRRVGEKLGQLGGIIALVITAIVFLTTVRRQSDQHYYARRRWNSLFMCRRCGQIVSAGRDS